MSIALHLTTLMFEQILTVQHPLEESRDCLAFATEPVFASLANVLGGRENLPSPLPEQLVSFSMFDIEIKYGLLQVGRESRQGGRRSTVQTLSHRLALQDTNPQ